MGTTKLSGKGQIVPPNSVRAIKPFAETRIDQVIGSAGYSGPRQALTDMGKAIVREARKRR